MTQLVLHCPGRCLLLAGMAATAVLAIPPSRGGAGASGAAAAAPARPDAMPLASDEDKTAEVEPEAPELRAATGAEWPQGLHIDLEGRGFGENPQDIHLTWRDREDGPETRVAEFSLISLGKPNQLLFFKAPAHAAGEVFFQVTVRGRGEARIPFNYERSTLPALEEALQEADPGELQAPPHRAGRRVTPDEKARIIAYCIRCRQPGYGGRKHGLPYDEIARKCRVSASALLRWVEGKVPRIFTPRYRTQDERDTAVAYYRKHKHRQTLGQIAKQMGVSKSTLENWLERDANPLPEDKRRHYLGPEERDQLAAEALAAHAEGGLFQQFSQQHHINDSTLQNYVNSYQSRVSQAVDPSS